MKGSHIRCRFKSSVFRIQITERKSGDVPNGFYFPMFSLPSRPAAVEEADS